jgi:hypothetical protein
MLSLHGATRLLAARTSRLQTEDPLKRLLKPKWREMELFKIFMRIVSSISCDWQEVNLNLRILQFLPNNPAFESLNCPVESNALLCSRLMHLVQCIYAVDFYFTLSLTQG